MSSQTTSQLDKILAATRSTVAECKASSNARELESAAAAHSPRGFARELRKRAEGGVAVIAELKKASPSRGLIRPDLDVPALAASLAGAGAAALSVLTEEVYFQGNLRNLELASEASGLPCLRKDFIVDEFQLLESRAHRADAVLLIAAALGDLDLRELASKARSLGLDVLCEVHTAEELDRILNLGVACDAIGVNNRNLGNFEVRLQVSLDLAPRLPSGVVRVAESGIDTAEDLNRLREAGFHAFLIGEGLMRQPDPGKALRDLRARTAQKTVSAPGR